MRAATLSGLATCTWTRPCSSRLGKPAIVGRPAIRDAYERLLAHGGLSLSLSPSESVAVGGEARERGSYRLAAGDPVLLDGKYIVIARPDQNAVWRYVWTTVAPD